MKFSSRSSLVVLAFALGPVGFAGCSKEEGSTVPITPPSTGNGGSGSGAKGGSSGGAGNKGTGGATGSGGATGNGGAVGSGGSVGTSSGGASGSAGGAGGGGSASDAAAPADTGAGTAETGGGGGTPDAPATTPGNGWMGYPGIEDLSMVKPTPGCGKPNMAALNEWIQYDTAVAIPANHNGPGGDGTRRYFVKLPTGYDVNKTYKVVIGGSSCVNRRGPLPIDYAGVTAGSGGVIQISPETEVGVMQEGAYVCYDDKDTNSIEYPLIEKMLKEVGEKFCFDQHKVFVQGHSSGGWYANMMGCVYGSTLVRAMSSNGGGIPTGAGVVPPCKDNPTPGLWIHPTGDSEEPESTKRALDRALKVNKCEGGGAAGAWQSAPSEPWTMAGATGCKKYKCPEAFPVIFCQPGGGHGPVSWHDDAGWAFFNALP